MYYISNLFKKIYFFISTMENIEMKNLATDIREACYKISRKPDLVKTSDDEVYDKFLEESWRNEEANQEILLERPKDNLSDRLFYVNRKEHFVIEIFKTLSEEWIYTQNKEDLAKLFTGIRPIKEKNGKNFIQTETGDIHINFCNPKGNTPLTEKISEDSLNKKIWMYLLGEHAFIDMDIPGWRNEWDYKVIPATQSDLIAILEALKKLT